MTDPVPLTGADQRILGLESGNVVGHTCKVIRLASPGVDHDQLLDEMGPRIAAVPELNWKLGGSPETPAWVTDPDFQIERHIRPCRDPVPVRETQLTSIAAGLFVNRLDRDHPLWRIDLIKLEGGGTALVWRIHHALADGITAMRLADEALWSETSSGRPQEPVPIRDRASREADHERRRAHLLRLFEHEFSRSPDDSPFDGSIGAERRISFATTNLGDLHEAAGSVRGATLNDAVLAVIAAGLRRWIDLHPDLHINEVRVKVPVSLHLSDHDAGNLDSYFSLPLPIGLTDPVLRLEQIREETSVRKEDHEAEELDAVLRRVSHVSSRIGSSRSIRSPRSAGATPCVLR